MQAGEFHHSLTPQPAPSGSRLIISIESEVKQGRLEEIGENRVFPALFDGERKDGTPQQEDSGHFADETG